MSLRTTLRTVIAAFALLALPQAALAAPDGLKVSDAWVRFAPPVLKTHGGYFTLTNSGAEPQELIAATSTAYDRVELHESRVANGVATMQRLESIEVPAGGKVEFMPGGLHLMLIGPKAPLAEGASVPLTLSFRSGAEIAVEAKVLAKAPGAGGAADHGGVDHGKMDHGHHTQ